MADQPSVALVSRQRALLAVIVAALLLAFNYGSTIGPTTDAAIAAVVYLVGGYLTLTLMDLLFDRLP